MNEMRTFSSLLCLRGISVVAPCVQLIQYIRRGGSDKGGWMWSGMKREWSSSEGIFKRGCPSPSMASERRSPPAEGRMAFGVNESAFALSKRGYDVIWTALRILVSRDRKRRSDGGGSFILADHR